MSEIDNAIIFICQQGRLEIESLLLVSSMLRFPIKKTELIAAIPGPSEVFGNPSRDTLDALESMGVKIAHFKNDLATPDRTLDVSHYLANKIFALKIPSIAKRVILMDSDHICHRPFEDLIVDTGDTVGARPAGPVGQQAIKGQWSNIFKILGFPADQLTPDDISERKDLIQGSAPPVYLNSGLILLSNMLRENLSVFWEDFFSRLNSRLNLNLKRYYLEQSSLTPAIIRAGYSWKNLDDSSIGGCYWHYFEPEKLSSAQFVSSSLANLIHSTPALKKLIIKDRKWRSAMSSILNIAQVK